MTRTKKLLSLVLVLLLIVGTIVTSGIAVQGDEEPIYAWRFDENLKQEYNNGPGSDIYDNGSLIMSSASTRYQSQHQLLYRLDSDAKAMMNAAVKETVDQHDGLLVAPVTLEKCHNKKGKECSGEIVIELLSSEGRGNPVARVMQYQPSGSERIYSLDVSAAAQDEIIAVYVCVQYYAENGGCADLSCTFAPFQVETGAPVTAPSLIPTTIDVNRTTFMNFRQDANRGFNYAPDSLRYSADGSNFVSSAIAAKNPADHAGYIMTGNTNFKQQAQIAYNLSGNETDAKNALAMANSAGGTGKLKVDVTLISCIDPNNESTISEIQFIITGQADTSLQTPVIPPTVKVSAWQYPGTTRTYYLDVSEYNSINEILDIRVYAQNYWYYNSEHQMVDISTIDGVWPSNAQAMGYTECQTKTSMLVTPISVVKPDEDGQNVPYSWSLDGYNVEGEIPEDLSDPSQEVTSRTSSMTAPVLAEPTVSGTSVSLSWSRSNNADYYTIYRKASTEANFTVLKDDHDILSYTDTTVKQNVNYEYYVEARTLASTWDVARSNTVSATIGAGTTAKITTTKIATTTKKPTTTTVKKITLKKPVVKLKAAKKKLTVSFKKIKNAKKYQVRYRVKGTKKWKTKTIKKTKVVLKKLKGGKKYQVRVRAFTTQNGKRIYSSYSRIKTLKVKK